MCPGVYTYLICTCLHILSRSYVFVFACTHTFFLHVNLHLQLFTAKVLCTCLIHGPKSHVDLLASFMPGVLLTMLI